MRLKRFENILNENKYEKICNKFKKFGKVEKCEEKNDHFHLIIKEFSPKDTLKLMNVLSTLTKYPLIDKINIDDNICDLILMIKK